jgi:hypothetical protein
MDRDPTGEREGERHKAMPIRLRSGGAVGLGYADPPKDGPGIPIG